MPSAALLETGNLSSPHNVVHHGQLGATSSSEGNNDSFGETGAGVLYGRVSFCHSTPLPGR